MPTFLELRPLKWVQNGFTLAPGEHPVFVHGALPGEKVRVRLTKRNRNHSFAVLESVIEPSPSRIESDCSIFPECGGCSFRNISYEEELSVKTRLVREFRPLGEACGDFEVFSAAPDAYRTHVRIQFDGKQAGFFSLHSNRIVPLPSTGCANLPKELNSAIFGFIKKETRARTFAPRDLRFRISDKVYGPSHHGTVPIAIGSLTLDTPADGFVQANSMLIETWLKFIASLIGPGLPPALELYCGSGIIGAYVRENLGSYRAFDFNSSSIECARKNFSNSGLEGQFDVMDLNEEMPEPASLCIVNPARPGLSACVREGLKASSVRSIIYSSCNPATLNRDLVELLAAGFFVRKSAMFDFFPRTPHVEMVCLLERK
ncbi:MAG TPA: methyltransferase [Leptospiraceae bacterium]|nr:methyltransferase [Leptospiraceae bacterium]HNN60332.1 methyltransferase [Leptospiraceae bacterium]